MVAGMKDLLGGASGGGGEIIEISLERNENIFGGCGANAKFKYLEGAVISTKFFVNLAYITSIQMCVFDVDNRLHCPDYVSC
jgi:hypothetical protein